MKDLFPPIVPSYIPAFTGNDPDLYFNLSPYNTQADFEQYGKYVHITVRYQSNNASALSATSEIYSISSSSVHKMDWSQFDDEVDTPMRGYSYRLQIPGSILTNGFEIGQLYKVQIRLCSDSSITNVLQSSDAYSEWSTVCLFKRVSPPVVKIVEFDSEETTVQNEDDTFANQSLASTEAFFTGVYELDVNKNKDEKLNRYKFILSEKPDNSAIYTEIGNSGWQTFDSYNFQPTEADEKIKYYIPYNFHKTLKENKEYSIYFLTETINGYRRSRTAYFDVITLFTDEFAPTVKAVIDEEEAYATITVRENTLTNQRFTLCRTSSETGYESWEDLYNFIIKGTESTDITYYDFTIKSGVIYQYGIQTRNSAGFRRQIVKSPKVYSDFDHTYLLGKNGDLSNVQQLKLKYNTNVSSLNITVQDSKIDTIGSKYPYFSRNGIPYYKMLSISGLITGLADDQGFFTSKHKLYGDADDDIQGEKDFRQVPNHSVMRHEGSEETITYSLIYNPNKDYNYERDFREAVMDFLYDGKPKLFKSPTEGNMIVRLMDVSLSPMTELGRLLYDFSANVVQIADYTLDDLRDNGILDIIEYNNDISYQTDVLGQFTTIDTGDSFPAGWSLKDNIENKYALPQDITPKDNYVNKYQNPKLKYVRIQFDGTPVAVSTGSGNRLTGMSASAAKASSGAVLGWSFSYDGTPVVLRYPNNIYEISSEAGDISSNIQLKFAAPVTIDYIAELTITPGKLIWYVKGIQIGRRVGQLYKKFLPYEDFVQEMKARYYKMEINNNTAETIEVSGIYSIGIEAPPDSILYLQTNSSSPAQKLIMNETGYMEFDTGTNSTFTTGYFTGMRIPRSKLCNYKNAASPITAVTYTYTQNSSGTFINIGSETYEGTLTNTVASEETAINTIVAAIQSATLSSASNIASIQSLIQSYSTHDYVEGLEIIKILKKNNSTSKAAAIDRVRMRLFKHGYFEIDKEVIGYVNYFLQTVTTDYAKESAA